MQCTHNKDEKCVKRCNYIAVTKIVIGHQYTLSRAGSNQGQKLHLKTQKFLIVYLANLPYSKWTKDISPVYMDTFLHL